MIEVIDILGGDPMFVIQKPNGEWVTFCYPAFAEGGAQVMPIEADALDSLCLRVFNTA